MFYKEFISCELTVESPNKGTQKTAIISLFVAENDNIQMTLFAVFVQVYYSLTLCQKVSKVRVQILPQELLSKIT